MLITLRLIFSLIIQKILKGGNCMNQGNESGKSRSFYSLEADKALELLRSSKEGLTNQQAVESRAKYGSNELQEGKKKPLIVMFLEQFKDLMIIILLVASIVSGFIGELSDTFIILLVIIINAILGVTQESKAEKALAALKKMSSPFSKVKRNGEVTLIKSEEIVPGDIVYLEAGDIVPADIRLIESASLKMEEAALTGESVPSEKNTLPVESDDTPLGDRKNMAFSGSSVTYGRGYGVVTHTGMSTEVGKIAGMLTVEEAEMTPLQVKLKELGKILTVGILVIAAVIFGVGVLRGHEYLEMILVSISLAVAAIPEGLPAIVTIVLAIGVQKMAKRNAIIRKLPAVETLGSTQIICSDKTGTLTQNKMTVKEVYFNGASHEDLNRELSGKDFETFLKIMVLCNDSKVSTGEGDEPVLVGDPTETALISYGQIYDFDKTELDAEMPRLGELPFDSERKLMTTVNRIDGGPKVLTKGAPDVLIERCRFILLNGEVLPLTEELKNEIRGANSEMAKKALRVLAMAYREIDKVPSEPKSEILERELIFSGLVGMIDPPRPEVKDAVEVCRNAGIRAVMITGDHRDTAAAIAKELNLIKDDSQVITGSELDKISEEAFASDVTKYCVYARVSPEHKVRIVKAWRGQNRVVAMTGDGVNDAPALKAADIGVGMGITGTEVSKGVSDMVLADDNFATIVYAVKEGRKIYSNIRKAIQFLLSANLGEVLTLFIATMLNWEILLPIHILWINLVTDTFPAIALGIEEAESDVMRQPPRKANNSVLAEGVGTGILYQGIFEGAITLLVYALATMRYDSGIHGHQVAMTMAFATLGLIQLFHSFNIRSSKVSIFKLGFTSNKYLLAANIISGLLLILVIILPGVNDIFRVQHLNLEQWAIVFAASFSIIIFVEIVKIFKRNKNVNK